MEWSQRIVLALFLTAITAVYFFAGVVVVGAIYRRIKHRTVAASSLRRVMRVVVLVLAGIGIGCMVYGYFIEPRWLETTHVKLTSSKLPPGSRPIRIVHISDLHCERQERLEGRLVEVIRQLEPDGIVFTGDALNPHGDVANFRRCMKRLAEIAPTFAVEGNLDIRWRGPSLYEGTGVRLLDGKVEEVTVGPAETTLRFVGGPMRGWRLVERILEKLAPGVFTVVLYHDPDFVEAAARHQPDLYLAGHTHGGQVALPGYGALVTFSKLGKTYESGLYRVAETYMYVNRGIGMEGGLAPPVRFWARPEVTLIEISPADSEAQQALGAASAPTSR